MWHQLEGRAVLRQRRGLSGQQARCTGCRAFIANRSAECPHCGFWPGQGYIG